MGQLLSPTSYVSFAYHHRDMGVMDENGAITIHGRTADAVRFKVFAEVVYPGPIEDVLMDMPAVRDAQVHIATVLQKTNITLMYWCGTLNV